VQGKKRATANRKAKAAVDKAARKVGTKREDKIYRFW
jgi:hypothetical protein